MADIKLSWLEFDAGQPADVRISWVEFDSAQAFADVRLSWLEFDSAIDDDFVPSTRGFMVNLGTFMGRL